MNYITKIAEIVFISIFQPVNEIEMLEFEDHQFSASSELTDLGGSRHKASTAASITIQDSVRHYACLSEGHIPLFSLAKYI